MREWEPKLAQSHTTLSPSDPLSLYVSFDVSGPTIVAMYLVKEEPSHYSFAEFQKDGGTTWSGVKNPLAQKHLRSIRKGDLVFYYHTGDEKAVVGLAKAATDAYPDPADRTGRAHVVDLVPVKPLPHPVTLKAIKADKRFADFALVRMSRLSVMPVTGQQWKLILAMSQ